MEDPEKEKRRGRTQWSHFALRGRVSAADYNDPHPRNKWDSATFFLLFVAGDDMSSAELNYSFKNYGRV